MKIYERLTIGGLAVTICPSFKVSSSAWVDCGVFRGLADIPSEAAEVVGAGAKLTNSQVPKWELRANIEVLKLIRLVKFYENKNYWKIHTFFHKHFFHWWVMWLVEVCNRVILNKFCTVNLLLVLTHFYLINSII